MISLWTPRPDSLENTRLHAFMRSVTDRYGVDVSDYEALHRWSLARAEDFWRAVWDFCGVVGDQGDVVVQSLDHAPYARFFPDSQISFAENILSYGLTHPDEPAIIARCQDGEDRSLTWQSLMERVSIWQQILCDHGVGEGDCVSVYLPNIPETVIVFLAASNLGAVFTCAGMEMGRADLINRFSQVGPKILITQDSYVHGEKIIDRRDVIEAARESLSSLAHVLFLNGDGFCKDVQVPSPQELVFKRRDFNHPLAILFSSGSTGKPKCFEHSSGGVLFKHLVEFQLNCDVREGDRVFYHATPSWMMWNWLVSGLASGATILMYDGNPFYPDATAQWNFTCTHRCTHHGTAAPVILGWEKAGVDVTNYPHMDCLRVVLSTGAVLPEQSFLYIHEHIKGDVKISSIAGGTDLVGCFLGGNPFASTYSGCTNGPILGCDVQVWDDHGVECAAGEAGELVCVNAFPSMPLRFLNDLDGERYENEYFAAYPGQRVWKHGDSIQKTPEGQFIIIGRSDATLNQNGVRIGASALYDQLAGFKEEFVDYAAVDFMRPDNKQAITVLFLVMAPGWSLDEGLQKRIKSAIKDNITPYVVPTEIIEVPGILKTPNGKKAEVVMKKVLAGQDISGPELYGVDFVRRFQEIAQVLHEKYAT